MKINKECPICSRKFVYDTLDHSRQDYCSTKCAKRASKERSQRLMAIMRFKRKEARGATPAHPENMGATAQRPENTRRATPSHPENRGVAPHDCQRTYRRGIDSHGREVIIEMRR